MEIIEPAITIKSHKQKRLTPLKSTKKGQGFGVETILKHL